MRKKTNNKKCFGDRVRKEERVDRERRENESYDMRKGHRMRLKKIK